MIPISSLLAPQEAEPKSLGIDLNDDEYISASRRAGVGLVVLMSGFLTVWLV